MSGAEADHAEGNDQGSGNQQPEDPRPAPVSRFIVRVRVEVVVIVDIRIVVVITAHFLHYFLAVLRDECVEPSRSLCATLVPDGANLAALCIFPVSTTSCV